MYSFFTSLFIIQYPLTFEGGYEPDYWCRNLQNEVKKWGFTISIIFLLLTIFVYIAEDSLRYTIKHSFEEKSSYHNRNANNMLVIKIRMAFLLNLTISYFLLLFETHSSGVIETETSGCYAKAYFLYYFMLVEYFLGETFKNFLFVVLLFLAECYVLQYLAYFCF